MIPSARLLNKPEKLLVLRSRELSTNRQLQPLPTVLIKHMLILLPFTILAAELLTFRLWNLERVFLKLRQLMGIPILAEMILMRKLSNFYQRNLRKSPVSIYPKTDKRCSG